VANLFVHPLIAWPEKAFGAPEKDLSRMDEWFVTTEEFERSLGALEARGYILVRVSDLFDTSTVPVTPKPLVLPPGRKPLILSVDDLNYYPYMRANGTVSRLWVDQDRLMARTFLAGGTFRDDDDKEVPQVLEKFLTTHPDFSYQGARGLIAVTGYQGLFGWPTQWAGPALNEAKIQAKAVARRLKDMGWEFATHSYAHRSDKRQSFEEWKASEVRWDNEVGPLVGPTPYYVLPFGEHWWSYPERWEVMTQKGYRVYFGVETKSNLVWKDGLPIVGRVPLDGRGLRRKFGILSPFLDPKTILDPLRPKVMKY